MTFSLFFCFFLFFCSTEEIPTAEKIANRLQSVNPNEKDSASQSNLDKDKSTSSDLDGSPDQEEEDDFDDSDNYNYDHGGEDEKDAQTSTEDPNEEEEETVVTSNPASYQRPGQKSSFIWTNPCATMEMNREGCNTEFKSVLFDCNDNYNHIKSLEGPTVNHNGLEIFIGYNKHGETNLNPVLIAFENGHRIWCREDYERSPAPSVGYGLFSDGKTLLAAFATPGNHDNVHAHEDFRQFSANIGRGWLRSAWGGSAQISFIGSIRPSDGYMLHGTYVSGRLTNNQSSELIITNIEILTGGNIKAYGKANLSPVRINHTTMTCSPSTTPEDYQIVFTPSLDEALDSRAKNCL